MRRARLAAPLFLAAAFLAHPASAQSTYTPDQVVEFLVNSVDLGAARAICIGTPQECAVEPPRGLDMMVNFPLDSAELTPEARDSLTVFASALRDERLEIASFVVEGHTDAIGSDAYNVELSERRAAAVKTYLIELGVSQDRLTALGLGQTAPRADDPFDPANRRVELRINLQ